MCDGRFESFGRAWLIGIDSKLILWRGQVESPSRVKNLMQADVVAIAALQTAEDNRRCESQYPENNEGIMDSVNHLGRVGVRAGNEKCRG
jgi:hypothetical protein